MKKLYMHTMDRKPAYFDEEQIVWGIDSIKTSQMCKSFKQVMQEQTKSLEYRRLHGFSLSYKYAYLIVYIDEEVKQK